MIQQEADRLIARFDKIPHSVSTHRQKERSILCAIFCVDEMLNDTDASSPFEVKRLEHWNKIKQELESRL
jgi:hypothetical protein